MKAKIMRSFAAGIILASGVSGAVYFFGPSKVVDTQKTKIAQPTEEEMKESLKSDGYIVLTEDEWVEELAAVEAAKQEEAKQAEQATDKKEEQKEQSEEVKEVIIYRTVLNVASGMTSIDVGNALVKGKIIDNAKAFFDEVEKRGLANELRPGTFELDSKMSMDEVINTIF
jgi:septum formation inhibitor MinC